MNNRPTKQDSYLLKAAFRGDIEKAKEMLQAGARINIFDGNHDTPLHFAIRGNQSEMVKFLCEQQADIHFRNKQGKNALIEALFNGSDVLIVDYLMSKGAIFDNENLSLAYHGNELILNDNSIDSIKDSAGHSILHYAIAGHQIELVKKIKEKTNTTEANKAGQTALHIATRCNDLSIVQYLMQNGYDASHRDASDMTTFLTAAQCGRLEIMQWLLEENKERINEQCLRTYSALHEAASQNQLKVVKFLIESKLKDPLESMDHDGSTVLHLAALGGFLEMLKWLVTQTNAINGIYERAGFEHAPMSYALYSGDEKIIKWLILEKHVNINAPIYLNKSIFFVACANGNLPLTKWLLEEGGANVNVKDNWGITALHLTTHVPIIEYLINVANADLFATASSEYAGKTPLQFQLSDSINFYRLPTDEKQFAVIRALLERGAGIKEDFSGINYLEQLDMSDCVLIGATANGKPVNCKGAIHNKEELLEAISNGVNLNIPALQKAIVARLKQTYDEELVEIVTLINKFGVLTLKYDLDLNEAYALTKPSVLPWILQGHLTQNQILPIEIIVKIGSFLMGLSDINTRKVFNAIFTKLFPEKNIYKFFTPNDQNNKLEKQESSEVKQQFALNHS